MKTIIRIKILIIGFTLFGNHTLFANENLPIVMPSAAATCVGCHGQAGLSHSPLWPNLAGQKKDYLVKQLHDFKKGLRKDPMMNPIVANLSEVDIQALGLYFSSLAQ